MAGYTTVNLKEVEDLGAEIRVFARSGADAREALG
jgi:hypothetical protein